MDIKELEVFMVVAEQLHFGRAGRICHLSPSAVTRTIQRLEEEIGSDLFVRDNRKVELSYAGERFRCYARRALLEYQEFKNELIQLPLVAGILSLYASITAVYTVLPDLLEAFRQQHPKVQLELHTGAAEQAVAQVEAGEMDIAVAAIPERGRGDILYLPIMTTALLFIASRQRAEMYTAMIKNEPDLAQIPLILPRTGLSRRRLDSWFRQRRIAPDIASEVSGNEAIIPMVHLGAGVGVVPQLVLERSPFRKEVEVLPGAPELEPYVVGLCTSRRNLNKPQVGAFWQLAEEQSRNLP
ncbi:MAG: HTH-type transcriptional activator IlvY [Pelovirga sp.]